MFVLTESKALVNLDRMGFLVHFPSSKLDGYTVAAFEHANEFQYIALIKGQNTASKQKAIKLVEEIAAAIKRGDKVRGGKINVCTDRSGKFGKP